ncbi:MAG: MarR family transcriptional regulator [Crenarchaeota archaeon]|nr:MarR family transcriptional regulator [Thermoproteota archaeon]
MRRRSRAPSGREITLSDVLRFCYDFSETDIQILLRLLKGNEYDVDTLAAEMSLSKATVNRSLNKLVELGFASRRRAKKQSVGRPRSKYYISDKKEVLERLRRDVEACTEAMRRELYAALAEIEEHLSRTERVSSNMPGERGKLKIHVPNPYRG